MLTLEIYHECPICRELFKRDTSFASHLIELHYDDLAEGDIRLDSVPEDVLSLVDNM